MLPSTVLKGIVPDQYILPLAVVIVVVSAICISYLDTTEDEYNKCKSWKQQLMMFDLVFKLGLAAYILSNKTVKLSPIVNAYMLFIGASSMALITFVMFGKENYTDWRRKFGYMFYYLTIGMTIADVILTNKQRTPTDTKFSETSASPKGLDTKFSETSASPKVPDASASPKVPDALASPSTKKPSPLNKKRQDGLDALPQRRKMYSATTEDSVVSVPLGKE